MTIDYLLWRSCERFGIDPREAEKMMPEDVARFIAWQEIRSEEEARIISARGGL